MFCLREQPLDDTGKLQVDGGEFLTFECEAEVHMLIAMVFSERLFRNSRCLNLLVGFLFFFHGWPPSAKGATTAMFAAGGDHVLVLKEDGTLWSWGGNYYGQLGNEATNTPDVFVMTPKQVGSSTNWVYIAAGVNSSYGIQADGSLWGWGWTFYGSSGFGVFTVPTRLGTDTGWAKVVPVANGGGYAMKSDGSLWGWRAWVGDGSYGANFSLPPLTNGLLRAGAPGSWASVWPSQGNTYVIDGGGGLFGWGYNFDGVLAGGIDLRPWNFNVLSSKPLWLSVYQPRMYRNVYAIDGTIVGPATNTAFRVENAGIWRGIFDLAVQPRTILAFNANGTFYTNAIRKIPLTRKWQFFGDLACTPRTKPDPNNPGRTLPISSSLQDDDFDESVAAIDHDSVAGSTVQVTTTEKGTCVYADGIRLAATTTSMNSDTNVAELEYGQLVSANIGSGFRLAAGRAGHILGIKTDGTLWSYGYNYHGDLGNGSSIDSFTSPFVPISSDNDWIAVDAGADFSLGLKADGSLWGWGWHRFNTNYSVAARQNLRTNEYSSLTPVKLMQLFVPAANGCISGQVTGQSGAALAGATVQVQGKSTVTDALGHFQMNQLTPGDATVTFSKVDYSVFETSVHIPTTDCANISVTLNLDLTAQGSVEGAVLDAVTGDGIAGAAVQIADKGASTDDTGHYLVTGLKQGFAAAAASANAYLSVREGVSVPLNSRTIHDFVLQPGIRIDELTNDLRDPWDFKNTNNPAPCLTNGIPCDQIDTNQDQTPITITIQNRYGDGAHFLDQVDLDVEFTAAVSWGKARPGLVTFITPKQTRTVAASGNEARVVLNVGRDFGPGGRLKAYASSGTKKSAEADGKIKVMGNPISPQAVFKLDTSGASLRYILASPLKLTFFNQAGVSGGTIPDTVAIFGGKAFDLSMVPDVDCTVFSTGQALVNTDNKGEGSIDLGGFQAKFIPNLMGTRQFGETDWGDWDLKLNLGGGAGLAVGGVVPLWPLPPTFLTASLSVSVTAQGQVTSLDPPKMNNSLNVTVNAQGTVFATLLVGSVAGTLSGTARAEFQTPDPPLLKHLDFNLTGSVKYYALWFQVGETKVLDSTWTLVGGQWFSEGSSLLMARDYLESPDYARFFPRALEPGLHLLSTNSSGSNAAILQSQINPLPQPHLAASGAGTALVWLQDATNRSAINRSEVVFSSYNGSVWTNPQAIQDDGTADFDPVMVPLDENGSYMAAWVNESRAFPTNASLSDVAASLEISTATYDGQQHVWKGFLNLTTNAFADFAPRLARSGAKICLTWLRRASNDLMGNTNSPTQIWYAEFSGNAWSAPVLAATVDFPVLSYDLASDGAGAAVVLSADTDGDLRTYADRELYLLVNSGGTWRPLQRLTSDNLPDDNPKLVYNNSEAQLVWLKNDELSMVRNFDFSARQVIRKGEYSSSAAQFQLARNSKGALAVAWPDSSAAGADLWVHFYDPVTKTWSQRAQVTADRAVEEAPTIAWRADDTLLAAYARVEAPRTDLALLQYRLKTDVAFIPESLKLTRANPAPGEAVLIEGSINNSGDLTVTNIPVRFYSGDPQAGGSLIGETNLASVLAPGDKVAFRFGVPRGFGKAGLTLFARVEITDANPANNVASLVTSRPDLHLEFESWRQIGAKVLLRVRVENRGALSNAAFGISVTPTNSASVLAAASLTGLAAGAATEADLIVDAQAAFAGAVLIQAPNNGDFDTSDNSVVVSLNGEEFKTRNANLILSQTARGAVQGRPVSIHLLAQNAGPSAATGVRVICPLLVGQEFVSAQSDHGSWSVNSDAAGSANVVFALGTLTNGESAQMTLTLQCNGSLTLTNRSFIQAVETDPNPINNVSGLIVGLRLSNAPPTIQLLSPIDNSSYDAPAKITLTANASDTDGNVESVTFWQGTQKLGEVKAPPYSIVVSNVPAGFYGYYAVALDDSGDVRATSTAFVQVRAAARLPEVVFLSPAGDSTWNAGTNIQVALQVLWPTNGLLSRIDVYDFNTILTNLFAPPYTFTWRNATVGEHFLRAVGFDFSGLSWTSAPLHLTVSAPLQLGGAYSIVGLQGNSSSVAALNQQGISVGSALVDGKVQAMLWQTNGQATSLGLLPGTAQSYATAVNDFGLVVGVSSSADGATNRGFLFKAGEALLDLGTLGGKITQPSGINNSGVVVGLSTTLPFGIRRGFTWGQGIGMRMIGGSDFTSPAYFPNAINSSGQFAGWTSIGVTQTGFFAWNTVQLTNINALVNNDSSEARALNDRGAVTGVSYGGNGGSRAFMWSAATGIQALSLPNSWASSRGLAINNTGVVVGSFYDNAANQGAFIYANGKGSNLVDLLPGNSGWTLLEAVAINDAGQIAGNGLFNGQPSAFLLTPKQSAAPPAGGLRFDWRSLSRSPDRTVKFRILSDAGQTLVIEGSSDLKAWTPYLTNQNTVLTNDLQITAPNTNRFFLRARSP